VITEDNSNYSNDDNNNILTTIKAVGVDRNVKAASLYG
jgi:hypothetical protein